MDILDRAVRATLFGKQKKLVKESKTDRERRIALYASRVANDQDLWTGQPLHATKLEKDGESE